jgi:two-component system chemotaxis response regulator CheB
VVGTAANGQGALDQIAVTAPDIVTLDIEMPVMDGLQCLREIRKRWPRLPVIMLSTLTERGGSATLDALASGASDYVTKPSSFSEAATAIESIRTQLATKIAALTERSASSDRLRARTGGLAARPSSAPLPPSPNISGTARRHNGQKGDLVVIGVSTGGPNALSAVLPMLTADFPVPILITQHIPPVFSAILAKRLASSCQIAVKEAEHGETLSAGTAYIAPGDQHMVVSGIPGRFRIGLNKDQPENSCRPSVDVLFRSAAESAGAGTLAVILTGMGQDGLSGARRLRELGATVLAQDEATSVVWGMPGAVVRAGLADEVIPLERVAPAIIARVHRQPGVVDAQKRAFS